MCQAQTAPPTPAPGGQPHSIYYCVTTNEPLAGFPGFYESKLSSSFQPLNQHFVFRFKISFKLLHMKRDMWYLYLCIGFISLNVMFCNYIRLLWKRIFYCLVWMTSIPCMCGLCVRMPEHFKKNLSDEHLGCFVSWVL